MPIYILYIYVIDIYINLSEKGKMYPIYEEMIAFSTFKQYENEYVNIS